MCLEKFRFYFEIKIEKKKKIQTNFEMQNIFRTKFGSSEIMLPMIKDM